jgi:hypothetical protein
MKFKPGLYRDQTNYSNEGGWWECNKVRFRSGYPEKLGGWVRATINPVVGTCRQMFGWVTSFQDNFLALGTNSKVFIEVGGNLLNITPLRETTAAGDVTFAASTGSNVLTVTDTGSNAVPGAFVTFSGAVSLGGNVTAPILNAEHEIQTNIDSDSYTIVVSVNANASDTGDGGASVVGAYQIDPGFPNTTFGYGWGTGTWGSVAWGAGSNQPINFSQRTWFFDNFDNDLFMNSYEDERGPIYYWDRGTNVNPTTVLSTPAVLLSSLVGANEVPVLVGQILVSQNDKHLLAFGAVPFGSVDEEDFDPLLIRFASQDNFLEWEPTPLNSAGFLRISRGDAIIRALATRQEILVYTNTGLSSLQFTGTTDVFSLQELSDNISVMSPRCFVTANNVVFWMGYDKFYFYSGRVDTLPTTLWSHTFRNFNYARADNVIAGTNEGFNEVWWMYPSAQSNDNDSYVIYNYVEKIWYYGTIDRTAWLDSGLRDNPQAVGLDGFLYNHESGLNDDTLPMESFILSSDFDFQDGEQFMMTRRMIPDVKFEGSTATNPEVDISLVPKRFPGSSPQAEPDLRIIETSADVYTNQVFIRARGRSMAFKIGSDTLNVNWQLGNPRLDARPDGKR